MMDAYSGLGRRAASMIASRSGAWNVSELIQRYRDGCGMLWILYPNQSAKYASDSATKARSGTKYM